MFSGSNKLTIDDKGRLAIPARVRTQLSDEYGKQIAVTLGPECIEIFPAAVFRRIAEAIPKIADRNKRVVPEFVTAADGTEKSGLVGRQMLTVIPCAAAMAMRAA